ncbi:cell envelope biogenesis protein LolA [Tamlana nanhaiensis]|uniref:Cell envelope biogenesis protein LolA n=1 Tax=Neotamlana nanhaiensis TaxID=1382798 RepID=A0A0D7VZI0_9FLAO|nr:outer membrane lipoprotein carrier protein LolA [Tamlana nanhaiensis]KJD32118.1 cell envelope biogenesis protein LolA [Tamlana nanhaiensis]KJD32280.1 cell envelope biogenesis protein LolA [Tamlana nanhaiensis]
MNKILMAFLLVATWASAQQKMTNTEAETLKALVKTRASQKKTIVSDFTQYKHLDFLSNDIVTQGKLHYKSPGFVKWAYVKPFQYSIIFKNETLFINNEGNKSEVDVGSSKMFTELNNLIVNSVKGDMFDDEQFDISYFKVDAGSVVNFEPKDEKLSDFIKSFQISFDDKGDVDSIKMTEPSGDYTKIEFTNRVLNSTINDAIFNN